MATDLTTLIANFRTSLSSKVSFGDTTFSIVNNIDKDGVALPTGTYGFTLAEGQAGESHIVATLTGTTLTNVITVDRQGGQQTAVGIANAEGYRRGTSIKITNWVPIKRHQDLLDATTGFDSTNPIFYDGTVTFTTGSNEIVDVEFVETNFLSRNPSYGSNVMGQDLDMNGNDVDMGGGDIDMATGSIINLADGVNAQDAVTLAQLTGSIAGAPPNASETVKGVVEKATDAEFASGASTGGTGAFLFATPDQIQRLGQGITLTAGEDLTAGDTVGYASTIDDTVTKAVWAYRTDSAPGASGGAGFETAYAITNIGGDKYVALFESTTGQAGAVVFELDRDTLEVSFGTSSGYAANLDGSDIADCGTDKFVICYTNDGENESKAKIGTVSGTGITFSSESADMTPGQVVASVRSINFGTDRVASMYWGAAQDSEFVAIDASGATPVAIDSLTMGSNYRSAGINLVRIDTDKVVVEASDRAVVISLSGSTLSAGSELAGSYYSIIHYHSLISLTTDTYWSIGDVSGDLVIRYMTISGTTITNAGSYTITGGTASTTSGAATLLTDGTDVYMYLYNPSGTNQTGIYKLTWTGSAIEIVFITKVDMGGFFTGSATEPITRTFADKMRATSPNNYYMLSVGIDSGGSTAEIDYHVQGMTNEFIGIAQSTVSRGASVNVRTAGVDSNQTGLIAGAVYAPSEGGLVVSIDQDDPYRLQAQNGTDILI